MPAPPKVAAAQAKDRWIILDDVPGEDPARVKVTRVVGLGHGMVKLTMPKHPTLGSWSADYRRDHMFVLADQR